MTNAPYAAGDRVRLRFGRDEQIAIVQAVIETSSLDPERRWRLLCRSVDDTTYLDTPLHCGEDGHGPVVRPDSEPGSDAAPR